MTQVLKVFISHASTDKWVARQLARQLEEIGCTCFLDEKDIQTGDSIDEAIQEHLAESDEVLILLSPDSLKSHWVLIEVGGAKALKKRLVGILLHLTVNDVPAPIAKSLVRDLNDIEKYYEELRGRMRGDAEPEKVVETPRARVRAVQKRPVVALAEGVRVRLPAEPQTTAERPGADIGWTSAMNRFCGREAVVTDVDVTDNSAEIDIDGGDYWWAFEWLQALPPDPPLAREDLPKGARVVHATFGHGVVRKPHENANGDDEVTIAFDDVGSKHLLVRRAPMWLVDE